MMMTLPLRVPCERDQTAQETGQDLRSLVFSSISFGFSFSIRRQCP